MYDLTGFQRDLLYIIAGSDRPSGQRIKDGVDEYYLREVNHGRLYTNLDTLVEKGYVEKGQQDQRTNYYEITARGIDRIEEHQRWLNQYLEQSNQYSLTH